MILVVEGDYLTAKGMATDLEAAGHLTVVTTNGDQARQFTEGVRWPDVAIVDLHLESESDGEEIAIRFAGQGIPVLVVTGRPDAQEACRRIGPCCLLEKPVDPKALVDAVSRLATCCPYGYA